MYAKGWHVKPPWTQHPWNKRYASWGVSSSHAQIARGVFETHVREYVPLNSDEGSTQSFCPCRGSNTPQLIEESSRRSSTFVWQTHRRQLWKKHFGRVPLLAVHVPLVRTIYSYLGTRNVQRQQPMNTKGDASAQIYAHLHRFRFLLLYTYTHTHKPHSECWQMWLIVCSARQWRGIKRWYG